MLALSRQGLFFIPIILVTVRWIGLLGVEISQPLADIGTFILAIPLGISVIKELKELDVKEVE